jgi:hypothetical protein
MPDRSKGRGQNKCSHWSSSLGVECGAYDPTPEKFTVTKPWRRPSPTQGRSASKYDVEDMEIRVLKWNYGCG